jgi:hypothetical protein
MNTLRGLSVQMRILIAVCLLATVAVGTMAGLQLAQGEPEPACLSTIGVREVPVPNGAVLTCLLTHEAANGPLREIRRGASWVQFDDSGLHDYHMEAAENPSDFAPIIDALFPSPSGAPAPPMAIAPEPSPYKWDATPPPSVASAQVLRLGSTDIPLPPGAILTPIQASDPGGPTYGISLGNSFIVVGPIGIFEWGVHSEDAEAFRPAAEALQYLATQVTPPPIRVGSVLVPVPRGAVIGGSASDGGVIQDIRRGESFVRYDDAGVIQFSISPEDEADFAPTLAAIRLLGPDHTQ